MTTPPIPCLEHHPATPPKASVIWLHGLGATGNDFAPLVPELGFDDVRFVFPHAGHLPVTINGGASMPAWYDIRSLDRGSDRESVSDIRKSAATIEALIQREIKAGVPAERIVLAGFSQGGAMAAYVGSRFERRLAGLMILSAYIVVDDEFDDSCHAAGFETPVFVAHGRQDPMVPFEGGEQLADRLRKVRASAKTTEAASRELIEFHGYDMGHSVCPAEVRDIKAWLHRVLA